MALHPPKQEVPTISQGQASTLAALARMFVLGDGASLLTEAELAEDIALFDSQQAVLPNQNAPNSSQVCGFFWKDKLGFHHHMSMSAGEDGASHFVKHEIGSGYGVVWIRCSRFGDWGTGGNGQLLYDFAIVAGADAILTSGRPAAIPDAMLSVISDVNAAAYPNGVPALELIVNPDQDMIFGRGSINGPLRYRVNYSGGTIPFNNTFIPRATGGTLTFNAAESKLVHIFEADGDFVNAADVVADVFLLGGGGGGGSGLGAGGGGGGWLLKESGITIPAGTHAVSIGLGGASDTVGGTTSFLSYSAVGGGRGGDRTSHENGGDGACGGGGSCSGVDSNTFTVGGAGDPGTNGGKGYTGIWTVTLEQFSGGGGGGLGLAGGDVLAANPKLAGAGGAGIVDTFTGMAVVYGGGGGGGNGNYNGSVGGRPGAGGIGGGGAGGQNAAGGNGNGHPGTDGFGGGGGGSGSESALGGVGGKGLVMVRYAAMP